MSKIAAHGGILGVHRIAAGDKGHHAAGTHLVECFGKKVVVDAEIQLVIGFISNLINVVVLTQPAGFVKEPNRLMPLLKRAYGAVSYTHLDVYKRQEGTHTAHRDAAAWGMVV